MNTFFYQKLSNNGRYTYKNVKRWTKKSKCKSKSGFPDIFHLDKVLFPVHVGQMHWCAGVLNLKDKRIEYYDSLGGCHESFFGVMKRYVADEYRDKMGREYPGDIDTEWTFHRPSREEIPQQNNGCDCGVFTLKFLDR